jgi:hypothetical protein
MQMKTGLGAIYSTSSWMFHTVIAYYSAAAQNNIAIKK